MNPLPIPDDIRRFVIHRVPSVPYLEAALLMREPPQAAWPLAVLARRLYLNEEEVARILRQLQADGIAVREEGEDVFRFAPATPELGQLLERLADVYARNLVAISTLIHSKSSGKAQMLADAFVWRKDK